MKKNKIIMTNNLKASFLIKIKNKSKPIIKCLKILNIPCNKDINFKKKL